eukprot:1155540-Pelagomonas_calceolata.AAC.5
MHPAPWVTLHHTQSHAPCTCIKCTFLTTPCTLPHIKCTLSTATQVHDIVVGAMLAAEPRLNTEVKMKVPHRNICFEVSMFLGMHVMSNDATISKSDTAHLLVYTCMKEGTGPTETGCKHLGKTPAADSQQGPLISGSHCRVKRRLQSRVPYARLGCRVSFKRVAFG